MKNKNFVILGQQDWESSIGSNNINIAKEISRFNKVIYVDNALDRKTMHKMKDDVLVKKKLSYIKK